MTTANVGEAVAMFERVAEAQLATLSGVGPRARADAPARLGRRAGARRTRVRVRDRAGRRRDRAAARARARRGSSSSRRRPGRASVRLRAKADRIDLLADGTLRIIDYKLGKAPKPARVLQLPVYGVCAQQSLEGRQGRSWTLGRAGYVAFREKNAFVGLGTSTSLADARRRRPGAAARRRRRDRARRVSAQAGRAVPLHAMRLCVVCRKDYVGDE